MSYRRDEKGVPHARTYAVGVASSGNLVAPIPYARPRWSRRGHARPAIHRPHTLQQRARVVHFAKHGPAGARLAVIGLGYHPRTCLAIEVLPPRSDAGGAPTTPCGPGQVLVDATGRFRTSVTIPTSLRLATAAPDQPLVVMTYNDAATSEATTYKASSIFLLTL